MAFQLFKTGLQKKPIQSSPKFTFGQQKPKPFIGPVSVAHNAAPTGGTKITISSGNEAYRTPSGSVWEYLKDGTRRVHLNAVVGGGVYDVNPNDIHSLVRSERGYGGVDTQPGKQRDHIVPVSLGGASTEDNINVTKNNPASFEAGVAKDLREGKSSIAEARLRVMLKKNGSSSLFNALKILGEIVEAPLAKTANTAVSKILQPTADVLNESIGERFGAIGRSIKNKSFQPLSESIANQKKELIPQSGDSPQQQFQKLQNLALMVGVDVKPAKPNREKIGKPLPSESPIHAQSGSQIDPLLKKTEIPTNIEAQTQLGLPKNSSSMNHDVEVQKVPQEKLAYNKVIPEKDGNVKPPVVRGGITPPELNFTNWEDKSAIGLGRETFERNINRVAGADAPKIQKFITEPVRINETARLEFNSKLRKEIKAEIVEEKGIKPGSKEDALIQQYGEGLIKIDELKKQTPKWKEITEASSYFRNKYDELLDMVNVQREKFGYKPIPKRSDYFRHFEEVGNVINQLGVLFRENDIPTEISGLTNIFKPGKPFSTAELQRTGNKTRFAAIEGMDNYIDAVSKQMFHIDSVQRVRALEKYIRQSSETGNVKLPNLVANVQEYGNLIAGKKALIDRSIESTVGRKAYSIVDIMRKRIGSNMVIGNVSSALTNFIPLTTQFPATTAKIKVVQGLFEALKSPLLGDSLAVDGVKSGFLTRRFPEAKLIPEKIFGSKTLGKGADYASVLFNGIDFFSSRTIVAGKYFENVAKGIESKLAMESADAYASKVIADRSIGQTPNLFASKTLAPLTQFQLEVNNMVSFALRDIPELAGGNKIKVASSLAQFAVYSYLFNSAFEKITGRRPTIDPIQAALQVLGQTDDTENLDLKDRSIKAGKDLAGSLPFGNIVFEGGRIPISSAIPKNLSKKELLKPVFNLFSPFGGSQIKKTIEGTSAYRKGQVSDSKGKAKYKIGKTPFNLFRSAIFGASAVPEARQYYNKQATPSEPLPKQRAPAKPKPRSNKRTTGRPQVKRTTTR